MAVTLSGMVILIRPEQLRNASLPMVVMLLGKVMPVRLVQS